MHLFLSIVHTAAAVVGFVGMAALVAGACASVVLDRDRDPDRPASRGTPSPVTMLRRPGVSGTVMADPDRCPGNDGAELERRRIGSTR